MKTVREFLSLSPRQHQQAREDLKQATDQLETEAENFKREITKISNARDPLSELVRNLKTSAFLEKR